MCFLTPRHDTDLKVNNILKVHNGKINVHPVEYNTLLFVNLFAETLEQIMLGLGTILFYVFLVCLI